MNENMDAAIQKAGQKYAAAITAAAERATQNYLDNILLDSPVENAESMLVNAKKYERQTFAALLVYVSEYLDAGYPHLNAGARIKTQGARGLLSLMPEIDATVTDKFFVNHVLGWSAYIRKSLA